MMTRVIELGFMDEIWEMEPWDAVPKLIRIYGSRLKSIRRGSGKSPTLIIERRVA